MNAIVTGTGDVERNNPLVEELVRNIDGPAALAHERQEGRLRVTDQVISESRDALSRARVIVLQHMKSDTEEFLALLDEAGAEVFHVIAKPNSVDADALGRVQAKFPVTLEEYERLEQSHQLQDILADALAKCRIDHRRLLVLDVGGYFARAIAELRAKDSWPLAGVVEVTTFGHNRYSTRIDDIEFPVFTVARSPIKEVEARFVGNAAVTAIEQLMRELGKVVQGRRAVVNGYGMIGRNVASALRAKGMAVSVFDRRAYAMIDATTQGYTVGPKDALLAEAEYVFSATAQLNALSENDFDMMRGGTNLVSVGSRTNEFDVQLLEAMSTKSVSVSPHVKSYDYKGKKLNLIKGGKSVNFLVGSCQEEVMDLLFAEIATCFARLLTAPPTKLKTLHESSPQDIEKVSLLWLEHNRGFQAGPSSAMTNRGHS